MGVIQQGQDILVVVLFLRYQVRQETRVRWAVDHAPVWSRQSDQVLLWTVELVEDDEQVPRF